MNMEEKFRAAMQRLAADHDLDLVVEYDWANAGQYSFQARDGFEAVLRFPFNFQTGYSSFSTGGRAEPLGPSPKGGPWSHVQGHEHDRVIDAVAAVLDARRAETVRIVVLPDGKTYGPLIGSKVCEVPSEFDADQIENALAEGSLRTRGLR